MADIEEITEELHDIFYKYKEKQKAELFHTFNDVMCCDCGHKSRLHDVKCKFLWYKKMVKFYHIIIGFLSILMLILCYAFWAGRRYNQSRAYGNGGCISTFFWTYDDCTVYI